MDNQKKEMTPEEQLIQRYFDAFNRHDFEGVMACFHEHPVIIGATGKRCEGRVEVRRSYETEFAVFPDGHSDLRGCTGNSGHDVAESLFHGTRADRGRGEAIGAEVMEIADGKIKEIRDYHKRVSAAVATACPWQCQLSNSRSIGAWRLCPPGLTTRQVCNFTVPRTVSVSFYLIFGGDISLVRTNFMPR